MTNTQKRDPLCSQAKTRETEGEIRKPRGIIVFGANGSGKTMPGCELARLLDDAHMDIETYAFQESRNGRKRLCPVIRMDGMADVFAYAAEIAQRYTDELDMKTSG